VLDLHLVGVEQHRDGGQRSQPAPGPVPQQQLVDHHRDAQPEQMLYHGDRTQATERQQELQDEVVADRTKHVGTQVIEVVQVAE
jgi:hypothetical protein